MTELVEALKKLHSVRLSDKWAKEILNETLREGGGEDLRSFEQPGVFGGPHTEFLNNGRALLDSIMERRKLKKPFYTMEVVNNSQDIRIQSSF